MEYKFSDRVLTLKPSAIREIFKYAADPTVVSLSAGNPSPEAFPVKEIAEISARIFAERPIDAELLVHDSRGQLLRRETLHFPAGGDQRRTLRINPEGRRGVFQLTLRSGETEFCFPFLCKMLSCEGGFPHKKYQKAASALFLFRLLK